MLDTKQFLSAFEDIEKDSGIVSFVISSNLSNLFNELGYELLYKAYVISNS